MNVPTWLLGVEIVGLAVVLSLVGMFLVRRLVPVEFITEHHEVAGVFLSMIGTAYSVLLAFVVFVVWTQYDEAQKVADQEANYLADVYRVAQALPDPGGRRIRETAREYAQIVVDEEWALNGRNEESDRAWAAIGELWRIAQQDIDPKTPKEAALYSALLDQITKVDDTRTLRLFASRDSAHPFLWFMLIAGGVLTILFTYFFAVRNVVSQMLMTAALAALFAFILFLIAAFDRPFTGDVHVTPDGFESALKLFKRFDSR